MRCKAVKYQRAHQQEDPQKTLLKGQIEKKGKKSAFQDGKNAKNVKIGDMQLAKKVIGQKGDQTVKKNYP